MALVGRIEIELRLLADSAGEGEARGITSALFSFPAVV